MKKSILILLAIINVACGESENLPSLNDNNEIIRAEKEDVILKQIAGTDCSEFGYTDTIHIKGKTDIGFTEFDDVNFIKIYNMTFQADSYVVVYEFEENPNSMWPTQSNSFRADLSFGVLTFSESCAYEMQ